MIDTELLVLFLFLAPVLPLIVFLIISKRLSSYLVIISGLMEILCSFYLLKEFILQEVYQSFTLIKIGEIEILEIGYWLNANSLLLLITVSIISAMVRIYAFSYLKSDSRRDWFMVLLGFFTFSMYGIVLMPNLMAIFIFWEWVGLSSYLMVGFWNNKSKAANAAKKTLLYNKIGDIGFIIALGLVYYQFGSFDLFEIKRSLTGISSSTVMLFNIGILFAVLIKSAQLPFSVWLIDAMEGPTPASALIHSATMVISGVYLVIRIFPLFNQQSLDILWYTGIVTAFWGGFGAISNNDIKRVLAYSTVSQLGFMFIALGAGLPQIAFFHLLTHAFYKSSLFLGSGIIVDVQTRLLKKLNREADPKDMGFMYEHWRYSPILLVILIPSALSLAAFPYTSGFLSKEGIITSLEEHHILVTLLYFLSFITAIYAAKVVFKPYRRNHDYIVNRKAVINYSGSFLMYAPLIVLVIFSFYGIFGNEPFNYESSWILTSTKAKLYEVRNMDHFTYSSIFFVSGGLLTALFVVFLNSRTIFFKEGTIQQQILENGLYLDKFLNLLYSKIHTSFIKIASFIEISIFNRMTSILSYAFISIAMFVKLVDYYLVDGSIRVGSGAIEYLGNETRKFQGGKLRSYFLWLMLLLSISILLMYIFQE